MLEVVNIRELQLPAAGVGDGTADEMSISKPRKTLAARRNFERVEFSRNVFTLLLRMSSRRDIVNCKV